MIFSTSLELGKFRESTNQSKVCILEIKKMKVKVLFNSSVLLLHSEAFISIHVDPKDLDYLSDFFQSIIINVERININSYLHSDSNSDAPYNFIMVGQTTGGVVHFIGVVLALVDVNVLSSNLVPVVCCSNASATTREKNSIPKQIK